MFALLGLLQATTNGIFRSEGKQREERELPFVSWNKVLIKTILTIKFHYTIAQVILAF